MSSTLRYSLLNILYKHYMGKYGDGPIKKEEEKNTSTN